MKENILLNRFILVFIDINKSGAASEFEPNGGLGLETVLGGFDQMNAGVTRQRSPHPTFPRLQIFFLFSY